MSKSRVGTWIYRLLLHQTPKPLNPSIYRHPFRPVRNPNPHFRLPSFLSSQIRGFCNYGYEYEYETDDSDEDFGEEGSRALDEMLAEVEREKLKEREEKKKAGINVDEEDEEDYMRVGPLIEKLEKEKLEDKDIFSDEEQTDSDSDDEDKPTLEEMERHNDLIERKFSKHEGLLQGFVEAETLDDAFKWMKKIDKFEQRHFPIRPEYRVIGELMNRLKVATGKEQFLLTQKLNRAMRMVQWKEAFDPNNPANYGVIEDEDEDGPDESLGDGDAEEKKRLQQSLFADEDMDEIDNMKERDDVLIEKLNNIDKELEEKLAKLDYTFGKKGKVLEEEIRDLAEERNDLVEKKKMPLYRKGFEAKLIDVNRTCKVTKGGQVVKYTAILVCGNYNGVIGYAKARAPEVPTALQKAYEKCFQNLHYVDRYEDHTIAHAMQTTYKKTKVYLWPASTTTGMKAGRHVQTILNLAGYKNVKSKVIGSRNPYNTVKAVFQALNAIETPKDVQEKFGRTVVESYLL